MSKIRVIRSAEGMPYPLTNEQIAAAIKSIREAAKAAKT